VLIQPALEGKQADGEPFVAGFAQLLDGSKRHLREEVQIAPIVGNPDTIPPCSVERSSIPICSRAFPAPGERDRRRAAIEGGDVDAAADDPRVQQRKESAGRF
jgi:hypothetical protein